MPRGDDWVCEQCSNKNYSFRDACNRCGAPRPAGSGGNKSWKTHREGDVAAKKPVDSVYVSNVPDDATEDGLAEHFGQIGVIKKDRKDGAWKIKLFRDPESGKLRGDATVAYVDPSAASAAVGWFHGVAWKGATLLVQLAEKAFAAGVSSSGGGKQRDWVCPNPTCKNLNFGFRRNCNKCSIARPADGGAAPGTEEMRGVPGPTPGAGRGRGRGRGRGTVFVGPGSELAKPGDWICKSCGNRNWAKRDQCNLCGIKRPAHEGEAREGAGGGFNERQDATDRREAKEDEVYDDFGRRRKNNVNLDRKAREAAALARLHAAFAVPKMDAEMPEPTKKDSEVRFADADGEQSRYKSVPQRLDEMRGRGDSRRREGDRSGGEFHGERNQGSDNRERREYNRGRRERDHRDFQHDRTRRDYRRDRDYRRSRSRSRDRRRY